MKRKDIKRRIKEYFFVNPTTKLRLRQIERKLKLPLPSVIRYCKELEEEGFLSRIRISNVVFYTGNRTNERFLLEKRFFNVKQLYEVGLVDYLKEKFNNPTIVLFGSYSKGEDTEESDIDLYIETPSRKKLKLDNFESELQRSIQIFIFRRISYIRNKHLTNNIVNGITLNGFLEVFK